MQYRVGSPLSVVPLSVFCRNYHPDHSRHYNFTSGLQRNGEPATAPHKPLPWHYKACQVYNKVYASVLFLAYLGVPCNCWGCHFLHMACPSAWTGSPDAHGEQLGPPNAHGCRLGPPDMHGMIILASLPDTQCIDTQQLASKLISLSTTLSKRLALASMGELLQGPCHRKLCVLQLSIVPFVTSPHISAYTAATQTVLTWELW